MQKDFHYYTIRILAEKAGFQPEEAQIIAYASQYVDDAIEHKPIKLPLRITLAFPRMKDDKLDPTCTAYTGMRYVESFKKSSQMQVFISFHFLPPEKYTGQKHYSYITVHNSALSKELLNNVVDNFKQQPDDRIYNLISLGIALHTYADTWAHEDFSGTHSHYDNNISFIRYWEKNKWYPISRTGKIKSKLVPSIGHAEAGNFPDQPFRTFKFQKLKNRKVYYHNNLNKYIDAAEKIFDFLKTFTDKSQKWSSFAPRLIKALSFVSDSLSKRCEKYAELFPEIGFYYNKNLWKNKILYPNKNLFLTRELSPEEIDNKWILFHKAAYEQRKWVLKNIKKL